MTTTLTVVPGRENTGPSRVDLAHPAPRPDFQPLTKHQIARGYQDAYFMLRDLCALKAHQITREGWEKLVRISGYVGERYNEVVLAGTGFPPQSARPQC